MSSKSANYCCSYNSGGHALLLLCEAELGDPLYELTTGSYTAGEEAIKNGSLSTWGKGMTAPPVWKDAGCVHPSLAGVKMVCHNSCRFTLLLADLNLARHRHSCWSDQRAEHLSAVQRVHLLRRRTNSLTLPASREDVNCLRLPTPSTERLSYARKASMWCLHSSLRNIPQPSLRWMCCVKVFAAGLPAECRRSADPNSSVTTYELEASKSMKTVALSPSRTLPPAPNVPHFSCCAIQRLVGDTAHRYKILHTSSAIASELVKPGLSMPNRLINSPLTPLSAPFSFRT